MPFSMTVTELNEYVKTLLQGDPLLRQITLKGEIGTFKKHSSGHMYFTLKDENASVRCVLFKQYTLGMRVQPREGMRVVLQGYASLYPRDGQFQFYAESLKPDGGGALYEAFLRLKAELEAEGLFDVSRKKSLPAWPKTIGVVTSPTGAVIRDIIRVSRRRNPSMQIVLCPVAVQGENAAAQIARGLQRLDGKVDVLLCGRGGGSLEDLWPFNEEIVVRQIADCRTPVISCVGHETDFTLADFAADQRAATPSQAAELAVPERDAALQYADQLRQRLDAAVSIQLRLKREALARLKLRRPDEQIQYHRERMQALRGRLLSAETSRISAEKLRLNAISGRLQAMSPLAVLARGYAIAQTEDGVILRSVRDAQLWQNLHIRLSDGVIDTTVNAVLPDQEPSSGS